MTITFPTELPAEIDRSEAAMTQFDADTKDHQLTVLHDDGVYRHLLFKTSGTNMSWYEILTSPGLLTINGDMGTFVFSRVHDMVSFFHGPLDRTTRSRINAHYWAEKVVASDGVMAFDKTAFERILIEEFLDATETSGHDTRAALWDDIEWELLPIDSLAEAHGVLSEWDNDVMPLAEWYELDLEVPSFHYLWCCWAIVTGLARYAALRTPEAPAVSELTPA